MWIFCFVCFCKRLKWPKGSEKGSPTELGQHIIPNFYLSVIRLVTTKMNWTKINSYGKMKSVLSFYSFYRIIVKFFYLKSLLDPVPKNEIQIFFSFVNHLITKHSDDLVFRILVFQKVYSRCIVTILQNNWYGLPNFQFKIYYTYKQDILLDEKIYVYQ